MAEKPLLAMDSVNPEAGFSSLEKSLGAREPRFVEHGMSWLRYHKIIMPGFQRQAGP